MSDYLPFNLNIADMILGWLILVSILTGFVRGAIRDIMGTTSWIVAAALGVALAPAFAPLLEPWLSIRPLRLFAAGGVIWIAVMMTARLLVYVLVLLIAELDVRGLNRMLGTLFGVARAFVLAVVLLGLAKPYFSEAPWWQTSVVINALSEYEKPVFNMFRGAMQWRQEIMKENGG